MPNSSASFGDEARLRALLNAGQIPEARAIVAQAQVPGGWATILALPMAYLAGPATGLDLPYDLPNLGEELQAHAGNWVALGHREIIDSDPSRKALRDRLRARGLLAHAVFLKVEGPAGGF